MEIGAWNDRAETLVYPPSNSKTLCSTFCTNEANYWQTRSIARPLCDSRATCSSSPFLRLSFTASFFLLVLSVCLRAAAWGAENGRLVLWPPQRGRNYVVQFVCTSVRKVVNVKVWAVAMALPAGSCCLMVYMIQWSEILIWSVSNRSPVHVFEPLF